jgi:hypothetical protein
MGSAYTKEYFDVHVNPSTPRGSTAAIFWNGKWKQTPGMSLEMTLYVVDPKYDYADVNEVRKISKRMIIQTCINES